MTDLPLDYLLPRFAHYIRTGQYPDGKGYDDQPQVLLDDFETLFAEYRHRSDQVKKDHNL